MLDFVASFVSPAELPSASDAWRLLSGARQAAYDEPWSHAVLRALELVEYRALPAHRAGWIAARIGMSLELEQSSLLSYNLGTVSREALQRLEALQRAYYRDMVSVIAESEPAECVVLYSAQLLELRGAEQLAQRAPAQLRRIVK